MKRFFVTTITIGLVIYAALTVSLTLLQERIIFPAPGNVLAGELPEEFEAVAIETADGERLAAFFHPPEPGEAAIIVFHGNADLAVWQLGRGRALAAAGFGVLLAEYRGYGASSGSPSETGLLEDARVSHRFVRSRHEGPIGVIGHSLGSGPASALAEAGDVAALLLEAPFVSVLDLAREQFPFLPVTWLLRHPFRNDQRLAKIKAPVLIVHGTRDRVVPFEHGRRLAALGGDNTRFEAIEGAGHQLVGHGSTGRAIAFFKEHMARRP